MIYSKFYFLREEMFRKFYVFLFVVLIALTSACSSKYNVVRSPVDHQFEKLDDPKTILKLVTNILSAEGENGGIHFMRWVSKSEERKYFKNFFKNFEQQYRFAGIQKMKNKVGLILTYKNMSCKEENGDCVEGIDINYTPLEPTIKSCKLDRTHKETGEKSTIYSSMGFMFSINYWLKGAPKVHVFASLSYMHMTDFEKYNEILNQIKTLFPYIQFKC